MIRFHAGWCEHCQKIDAVWDELAAVLCDDPVIHVGQVNTYWIAPENRSEEQIELKYQFEVAALPTIVLVRQQQFYRFEDEITVENLVKFAREGYQGAQMNAVKPAKGMFGKLMFILSLNLDVFNSLFDSLGISFISKQVKFIAVLCVLMLPVLGVLLCIHFVKEPETLPEGDRKPEEKKVIATATAQPHPAATQTAGDNKAKKE